MVKDIHKLGRAEESLWGSEEKFRNIFENITDIYYRTDLEGKLTFVNPAGVRAVGYNDPEEVVGKNLAEEFYYNPEDREDFIKELKKHGEVKNYEVILKRKDGAPVIVETNSHFIYDKNGKPIGVEGIARDITERKKTEEALKESEEKYRTLIETANDAIFIADVETGIILDANKKAGELLGLPVEEIVGMHQSQLHPPGDAERYSKIFQDAVQSGGGIAGDLFVCRKDGSKIPMEISGSITEVGGKKIIQGIFRDITERKLAEEALRESEEKYRNLFENSIEGIGISKGNRIISANKALLDIFGYESPEEFTKVSILDHVAHESRGMIKERLKKREKGEPLTPRFEYKIIRKDGEIRDLEISTAEVLIENEKCVQSTIRDITERKQTEEALRESEEKYRSFFEHDLTGDIISTPEGQLLDCNPAFLQIFGFTSLEEAKPVALESLYPTPVERQEMIARIEREKKIVNYEHEMCKVDGETIFVNQNTVGEFDEHNKLIKIRVYISDITERKKAEEALRESEERFRLLVENIPDVAWTTDQEGNTVFISPDVERVYGYTSKEIYEAGDRFWLERIHPDDVEHVKEAFGSLFTRNKKFDVEYRIQRKDGNWIWLHDKAVKTYEKKGVLYADGVFSNITERKQAEKEMKRRLMKFRLEDGNLYLVKEPIPTLSLEAFKDLLKVGYRGLVISRTPKEKSKKAVDDRFEFLWISERGGKKALPPDLGEIERRIENLSRKNAILIDRLDYLAFKNGFAETLSFVQRLRELAYLARHVVILSVDPSTFGKRELRLLEKETAELEPPHKTMLSENLLGILRFVYEQNSTGLKPSYMDIGQKFEISKPTVRKRIRRLISAGYLIDTVKGNRKVLDLTERGRRLFLK